MNYTYVYVYSSIRTNNSPSFPLFHHAPHEYVFFSNLLLQHLHNAFEKYMFLGDDRSISAIFVGGRRVL